MSHDRHHGTFDSAEAVAFIEREGKVFLSTFEAAADAIAAGAAAAGVSVRRILDVGCGPGVATCCLAERFPRAHIVAVDGARSMVARAAERAAEHGVADRVEARQVDVPADLPTLGTVDVVFASLVLHHLDEPVAALRAFAQRLGPSGLLALVEQEAPPHLTFAGVDVGEAAMWDRLDRAWSPGHGVPLDLRLVLAEAGLADVLADEQLTLRVEPPLDDVTRDIARRHLARASTQAGALGLVDPVAIESGLADALARTDVGLAASRRLLIARTSC
jgi:SAM-dependent methyltransferase